MTRPLAVAAAFVLLAACGSSQPPSAPTTPATPATSGGEPITGSERIGWAQAAADPSELATLSYAVYLDGARSEAAGVSCVADSPGLFACTSRLPAMASGTHTLQIAAFVTDGDRVVESDRSAALQLVKP
jgi:hypothetical protein